MYWSYLFDSKKTNSDTLTFESNDNFELLKNSYCELVIDKFFTSFSPDYDSIFISKFAPDEKPFEKEKKFILNFDDFIKAKTTITKSNI
jgi:hypothetical protein